MHKAAVGIIDRPKLKIRKVQRVKTDNQRLTDLGRPPWKSSAFELVPREKLFVFLQKCRKAFERQHV